MQNVSKNSRKMFWLRNFLAEINAKLFSSNREMLQERNEQREESKPHMD
eukprot:CAMPEP_0167824840 /NCGR_PEP_ID=MMETSP0112_2-20121227/9027_1 /TAXON_ID=91324 /ORGANISM="Lotharella globosa, Strain CCCM811" /LENGTH=48 /DNA_ID= /DNA_START= /DNA_END= /DNA_ORIENTATION=